MKRIIESIRKRRSGINLSSADVEATLSHIKDMWPKLTFTPNSELQDPTIIKVSNPYLIPSRSNLDNFDFNEMYYWDSFFMSLGFMITGENEKLVVGMLENLSQIFDQLQMIPNANRSYLSSHSQPPLLTTFINAADQSYSLNPKLKDKLMSTAQAEYQQVWLSSKKPHWRNVYQGLSRYYDINMLNDMAEAESGWDMTTRFNRLALEFLPVDLNSLLFKYEMDFHHFYQAKGDLQSAARWLSLAEERSAKVYELMWNPTRGMYFDYSFVKKRQGLVASLATYFPMWAGMVNEATAFKLKNSLHNFEYYGGLSTTTPILKGPRSSIISRTPTQWAYPNGWAPLHYIVTEALNSYGYHKDARRIALKWLRTCTNWYIEHHEMIEKYNVVHPNKPPKEGVYPSQVGFGWTNSIYQYFATKYL